jgi:hypothetical protein
VAFAVARGVAAVPGLPAGALGAAAALGPALGLAVLTQFLLARWLGLEEWRELVQRLARRRGR